MILQTLRHLPLNQDKSIQIPSFQYRNTGISDVGIYIQTNQVNAPVYNLARNKIVRFIFADVAMMKQLSVVILIRDVYCPSWSHGPAY